MRARPDLDADVSRLLRAWQDGDLDARDRLLEVVYRELRRRAAGEGEGIAAIGALRSPEPRAAQGGPSATHPCGRLSVMPRIELSQVLPCRVRPA